LNGFEKNLKNSWSLNMSVFDGDLVVISGQETGKHIFKE